MTGWNFGLQNPFGKKHTKNQKTTHTQKQNKQTTTQKNPVIAP